MSSYTILHWSFTLLFAGFGAIWGCFLGCAVYRLKAGISLRQPPSHCPHCQHVLRWYELLPIVSYLLQRAKCRQCQTPMSAHYALLEAACLIGAGALAWAVFPNLAALSGLFVAYCAVWFLGVYMFTKR